MGDKAQRSFMQAVHKAVWSIGDGFPTWHVSQDGLLHLRLIGGSDVSVHEGEVFAFYGEPVKVDNSLHYRILELRLADKVKTLEMPQLFFSETYVK